MHILIRFVEDTPSARVPDRVPKKANDCAVRVPNVRGSLTITTMANAFVVVPDSTRVCDTRPITTVTAITIIHSDGFDTGDRY